MYKVVGKKVAFTELLIDNIGIVKLYGYKTHGNERKDIKIEHLLGLFNDYEQEYLPLWRHYRLRRIISCRENS